MRTSRRQSNTLSYDFNTKEIVFDTKKQSISDDWPKKWIIYVRVSTEEQKQKGNGINAQASDSQRWAKNANVEIVWKLFSDEAVSWTDLQRKWLNEAIRFWNKKIKIE